MKTVVPVFPVNNLLPLSEFFQEPAYVWPIAVALHSCQDMAPVHSVIVFAEVQKNQEEWVLIDPSQILSKFEIQDGRPRSPHRAEAMEDVVEADTCPQTGVNDCLYHLPKCLH